MMRGTCSAPHTAASPGDSAAAACARPRQPLSCDAGAILLSLEPFRRPQGPGWRAGTASGPRSRGAGNASEPFFTCAGRAR